MADPTFAVDYGAFALRFLISVLWRNIVLGLDSDAALPRQCHTSLESVESEWRLFLLEKGTLEHYGRVHLIVTDFALKGSPQFNRYLTRDADATPMWTDRGGVVGYYAKFAKLVIFAELGSIDTALWLNTLVDPAGSTIRAGAMEVRDRRFGDFIIDRAIRCEGLRKQAMAMVSPAQRQRIGTYLEQTHQRFSASELGRALRRDAEWNATIPKAGRNESCPCGSGRKYKRCHGR